VTSFTGTSLLAVKQALRDEFATRPALSNVQVSYSTPGAYHLESDVIFFGGGDALHHEISFSNGGAFPVAEDYRLQVNVQAFNMETEGQEAADVRAVAMLNEVLQVVALNPQIAGVMMMQVASWIHHVTEAEASGSGYISRFEVQLRIRAQLN
jgi:hypothetical protein